MRGRGLAPWPTSWCPRWWRDDAVRSFVLNCEGRMTLAECVARGEARFGARFPSRSAVQRVWSRQRQDDGQLLADLARLDDAERLALAEKLVLGIHDPQSFVATAALSRRIADHARHLARASFEEEGERQ